MGTGQTPGRDPPRPERHQEEGGARVAGGVSEGEQHGTGEVDAVGGQERVYEPDLTARFEQKALAGLPTEL